MGAVEAIIAAFSGRKMKTTTGRVGAFESFKTVSDYGRSMQVQIEDMAQGMSKRLDEQMLKTFQDLAVGGRGGISAAYDGGITAVGYYPLGLSGCGSSLYPFLYMDQLGRSRRVSTGRQVERMLKCAACGVQYLLREAAEKVDNSSLIKLQCTSCGGDLEVK